MNADQERLRALRDRAADWRSEGLIDAAVHREIETATATPWRSHGVIVQGLFFVLTVIGLAAFYGFLAVIDVPGKGIIVGIAAIGIAEVLIGVRKWFGTGVEDALWLGGMIALITELPRSGTPESLLVLATGSAVAGLRVRNPLIGGLAAVLVVAWAEERFDLGLVAGIAMGALALVALTRTWRRPSTEWLWIVGATALPLAGWFAADAEWRLMTILLCAAFAIVAFALGLTRRHHAFFASGAIALALTVVSLAQETGARSEIVFALSGAFLLIMSVGVSRLLRGRREGFVLTPVRVAILDEGAIAMGSALAASQAAASSTSPGAATRAQDDGGFGGAGATGSF